MVAREFKRIPMRVPWPLRLRRLLRWGFLLPMAVLIPLLLWFLMGQGAGGGRFLGVVEAEAESVGSVGTVRILSVEVRPGQRVEPGDVLVRLDPAGPALDLAVQQARLLDFEQGTVRYRQALQESERRSRQIVQEAAVALEAERMNRIRDEAERSAFQAELDRLQPLVDQRLVGEAELAALRPRVAALDQIVSRYDPLIQALTQRHAQAVEDLDQVRQLLADADRAALEPVRDTSSPSTPSLRPGGEGESAELRATRAGIVSRIQYQAGDVVVGGQAIVRVTAERSRHITGMLTQNQRVAVEVGQRLQVFRKADPSGAPMAATVESIDPEIMDLLDPFNPAPRFPVRGRRVRARIHEEDPGLVPGETVLLRHERSGSRLSGLWPFGGP